MSASRGAQERTVPSRSIDDETATVLPEHSKAQATDELPIGEKWRGTNARPTEAPPTAKGQDLRHVHATMLLLAGVPVHVLDARLGHAAPTTRSASTRA
ncbi:hypothetical protein FXF69_06625 [Actinomadura chibensis]|uniref:Tyrosine-type recombinase/integrase n=1 Tax=Actinomadura chibensis TaxID=392828 RepID=A0A5D0NWK0_9ACTN|nr:hypothetical protein FXF69_06625 [Actinomadura chibensis]